MTALKSTTTLLAQKSFRGKGKITYHKSEKGQRFFSIDDVKNLKKLFNKLNVSGLVCIYPEKKEGDKAD